MRWPRWIQARQALDEPQVPVLLPQPLAAQVDDLLAQDRGVEAIRLVRVRTGLGLLPAHRAVALRGQRQQ